VVELRNIKPGGQSAALFEIPKDYTKSDNLLQAIGKGANAGPDEVEGGAAQVENEGRARAKASGWRGVQRLFGK
jgi:hypothetical protein